MGYEFDFAARRPYAYVFVFIGILIGSAIVGGLAFLVYGPPPDRSGVKPDQVWVVEIESFYFDHTKNLRGLPETPPRVICMDDLGTCLVRGVKKK